MGSCSVCLCGVFYVLLLPDVSRSDVNLTSELVLTFCLQSPLQRRSDTVFVSVKDVICIGVTDT